MIPPIIHSSACGSLWLATSMRYLQCVYGCSPTLTAPIWSNNMSADDVLFYWGTGVGSTNIITTMQTMLIYTLVTGTTISYQRWSILTTLCDIVLILDGGYQQSLRITLIPRNEAYSNDYDSISLLHNLDWFKIRSKHSSWWEWNYVSYQNMLTGISNSLDCMLGYWERYFYHCLNGHA